jgi:hypothetical protein
MNVLIDNKNLKTIYGIEVLDYTEILHFPSEKQNERTWNDKSGVDKNLENIRYEPREFVLTCKVKSTTIVTAYTLIKVLIDYMFSKGCFVLSLRSDDNTERECFLCERSSGIVPEIKVRQQNSLFVFKLGLRDVNPNALKFKNTITALSTTINYTKGQTAVIYWGNGDRAYVSNSGNYSKTYPANGPVDIIVDIDSSEANVAALDANFTADGVSGVKPFSVQFTDTSTGVAELWAWDFGDGNTSSERHPAHTYQTSGVFTVSLQVFNSVKGWDIETKTNYITVRDAVLLINGADRFLKNTTDKLLKN